MSKKLKLSQWHDGKTPPYRTGIYEATSDYCIDMKWSFFNNGIFNGRWSSKEAAMANRNYGHGLKVTRWRGIVK